MIALDDDYVKRLSFLRMLWHLQHASACIAPHCRQAGCVRYKRLIKHYSTCPQRAGGCVICYHFNVLCYTHGRECENPKCPVPLCPLVQQSMSVLYPELPVLLCPLRAKLLERRRAARSARDPCSLPACERSPTAKLKYFLTNYSESIKNFHVH